ncbi:peptide-methionine (S)-S-oxide reductase MsrA [Mariniluteicoccus endophyticus]
MFNLYKQQMVSPTEALPGRPDPVLPEPGFHAVLGNPIHPVPDGHQVAYLAAGCFWGVEKLFWNVPGVRSTAAGYMGGYTPNPTYEEVCSAQTGHTETVRVVFDPAKVTYADLLKVFYENHDPTQYMRQGNDRGTQYRSAIFTTSDAQADTARATTEAFQQALTEKGFEQIQTEVVPAGEWYYAEDYHQQYLEKNPGGYCPVHATGVVCNPA